jgi:hypothetical protein
MCVVTVCPTFKAFGLDFMCTNAMGMRNVVQYGLHVVYVCMCFCNSMFPEIVSLSEMLPVGSGTAQYLTSSVPQHKLIFLSLHIRPSTMFRVMSPRSLTIVCRFNSHAENW